MSETREKIEKIKELLDRLDTDIQNFRAELLSLKGEIDVK